MRCAGSDCLLDVEVFVGLEGEAPGGVGEDVRDSLSRVAAGAGLEEVPPCREGGPFFNGTVSEIDELDLVGFLKDDRSVAFQTGDVFLGAQRNPVNAFRKGAGSVGLDMDPETGSMEGIDEGRIGLQGRFAAGKADAIDPGTLFPGAVDNIFCAHFQEIAMVGVAERTRKVAPAHANEDNRGSGPEAFALEAAEYFVDPVHQSRS